MTRPPRKTLASLNTAIFYGTFKRALAMKPARKEGDRTVRVYAAPLGRKYGLKWSTVALSLAKAIEMLKEEEKTSLEITLLLPNAKIWESQEA